MTNTLTLNELQRRQNDETQRLKSLRLTNSRETEYDRYHRMWVPRSRVIGCDGVVRTTRKRNEEPMSPPKNSDYYRLFSAFTKMRSDGAFARWNIKGNGYVDYWCNLPTLEQPMITHYEGDMDYWDHLNTGMSWAINWDCVQDNVLLDIQNDGLDIATSRLTEAGFKFKVIEEMNNLEDNTQMINLIFRGNGCTDVINESGFVVWTWINNAFDGGPSEPPVIDL
jgi:hypothetical protein